MSLQKIARLGGICVIDPDRNMDDQKTHHMDALLDALFGNSKRRSESLVSGGLMRLRDTATDSDDSYEMSDRRRNGFKARSRILIWGFAVAALTLIAVTVRVFDTSQTAIAAVDASIAQSLREIGRSYAVTTRFRLTEIKTVERNADLFVKGGNRFAIRGESLLVARPVWFGSDRGKAWVVPPRGAVLEGDTENLMHWVIGQKDIATPYLHLSTMLKRLRDFYALKSLPDQWVKIGNENVRCRHILGKLESEGSVHHPDVIELWSETESGFAVRLIARWHLSKWEVGRESLQIQFQEPVELHDYFFTPDAHGGKNRPRIDFRSESKAP